jgi:L-fuconolactonase
VTRADRVIDAHLHVWNRAHAPYAWLDAAPAELDRPHAFSDIESGMRHHGVDAVVLVQADDHPGDTDLMLRTARAHPQVLGVVASLPLDDPDASAALVERYETDPLVVGIRTLSHDHPDPRWLLGDLPTRSLGSVADSRLTFELVPVRPEHVDVALELRARHAGLQLAVDHLATPPLGGADLGPWRAALAELATDPGVCAKVSGLYPRGESPGEGFADELRRVVDHAVDVFGPERLMFGSDWPVAHRGGGYDRVVPELLRLLGGYGGAARTAMVGGTATRFYGLPAERPARPVDGASSVGMVAPGS